MSCYIIVPSKQWCSGAYKSLEEAKADVERRPLEYGDCLLVVPAVRGTHKLVRVWDPAVVPCSEGGAA